MFDYLVRGGASASPAGDDPARRSRCLLRIGRAAVGANTPEPARRRRRQRGACRFVRSPELRRPRRYAADGGRASSAGISFSSVATSGATNSSATMSCPSFTTSRLEWSGCRSTRRFSMSRAPSTCSEHRPRSPLPSAGGVRDEIGLPLSVGVACTKHLAKVASQVAKPDGLVAVAPGDEADFLDPLPIGLIWGVGAATERRLHEVGIYTIGQLAKTGSPILASLLGDAAGTKLVALSSNLDERVVQTPAGPKSMGAQAALGRREPTRQLVRETLAYLADRVAGRLRKATLAGRTVTVRVRFAHLRSVTRSVTLPTAISTTLTLTEVAETLAYAAIRDNEEERGDLAARSLRLQPAPGTFPAAGTPGRFARVAARDEPPASIGRRGRPMGSGSIRRRHPGQVRPDRGRVRRGRTLGRRTSSRGVPRIS